MCPFPLCLLPLSPHPPFPPFPPLAAFALASDLALPTPSCPFLQSACYPVNSARLQFRGLGSGRALQPCLAAPLCRSHAWSHWRHMPSPGTGPECRQGIFVSFQTWTATRRGRESPTMRTGSERCTASPPGRDLPAAWCRWPLAARLRPDRAKSVPSLRMCTPSVSSAPAGARENAICGLDRTSSGVGTIGKRGQPRLRPTKIGNN